MDSPRIQDIPSIKKTLDDAKRLKSLKAFMPVLKPLLRLFGIDVNQMQSAFVNLLTRSFKIHGEFLRNFAT